MPDEKSVRPSRISAGLHYLIEELKLNTPAPAVRSEVDGVRRTIISQQNVLQQYPKSYLPEGLIGHLKFAMRNEPLDLVCSNRCSDP